MTWDDLKFWAGMLALIGAVVLIGFLASLGDSEETKAKKQTAFVTTCVAQRFSAEQCAFLYGIVAQAKSDSDNATFAASVAIGMSASAASQAASGSRR